VVETAEASLGCHRRYPMILPQDCGMSLQQCKPELAQVQAQLVLLPQAWEPWLALLSALISAQVPLLVQKLPQPSQGVPPLLVAATTVVLKQQGHWQV